MKVLGVSLSDLRLWSSFFGGIPFPARVRRADGIINYYLFLSLSEQIYAFATNLSKYCTVLYICR